MMINSASGLALNDTSRYLLLYGGSGSGKSVFAAQKNILRVLNERGHRILVVRKIAATLRNSVFALLKQVIADEGLTSFFSFTTTPMEIMCKANGNTFAFVGLDDPEKLKSITGITSIWFEEATEAEKQDMLQLDLRLRGQTKNYKQIILSFNPIAATHWLNRDFCQVERPNTTVLKTTYRDNTFIDAEYIEVLQSLAGQDENYFKIYSEGEWGTLENMIYKPFTVIEHLPDAFDETVYGIDFGYNNPTAVIRVGIKDAEYYLDECLFQSKLTNADLIERLKSIVKGNQKVYCDSAEPQRITEMRRAGINAFAADKNVKDGIDFVKRQKINTVKDNANLNKESSSYSYQKGPNGEVVDTPVKFNDHAMDAMRYAMYTHSKKRTVTAKLIH